MYNCYNQAIDYLKDRLGTQQIGHGLKEPVYLFNNIIPYSDEHLIHVLLTQYNYGIEAKKELYYKLLSLGVNL